MGLALADIRTEFLAADLKQCGKPWYCEAPQGGLPGSEAGSLIQLTTPIYVQVDASYDTLKDYLSKERKCVQSRLAPCPFYVLCEKKKETTKNTKTQGINRDNSG